MSSRSDFEGPSPLEPDHEAPPPAPRWVKAFGIGAIFVIVLLIVMIVSGHGGPHSPLRHLHSHDAATELPSSPPSPKR